MNDNTADGQALTEIQMAAAAAPAPTVVVAPTLNDAAQQACEDTVRILAEAVANRGVAHLALTGGSGGVALADSLAPLIVAQPEQLRHAIHLWFGDERFVPKGDPERNDMLATPLIAAGVRESQVHRLAAPQDVSGLDEATARMIHELEAAGLASGGFDVVHVGLGPGAPCRTRGRSPCRGCTKLPQASRPTLFTDLRDPAARRPHHGCGRRRREGGSGAPGSGSP